MSASMMDPIAELEPVAARLLERHLATTKEWYPHEFVPYSRGRDFDKGGTWSEADADTGGFALNDVARSALFVNILTEDNLPYYFRDIERMFGRESAWGEWVRRWTAEEGRHSIGIRDYLTVSRAIDPWELERARMVQVAGGESPNPEGPLHGMCYVALQELATRISHLNTGRFIDDPAAGAIMMRVAADENLHYLFYRDMATAAFELDPSAMMLALSDVVRNFAMPGTGIPEFSHHAHQIARAGIYDLAIHHNQILQPVVVRTWKVEEIVGLSPEADQARESMMRHIERTGKLGARLAQRRADQEEIAVAAGAAPVVALLAEDEEEESAAVASLS